MIDYIVISVVFLFSMLFNNGIVPCRLKKYKTYSDLKGNKTETIIIVIATGKINVGAISDYFKSI